MVQLNSQKHVRLAAAQGYELPQFASFLSDIVSICSN
jgi:hypothetical protein